MAGNEALISVVANISRAERSIDLLVKKLGAIQNTVINIDGTAAVKKSGDAVNAVKSRLSELGKEARTATGQLTRLIEGVGTLAVAGKGIGGTAAGLGTIATKATAAATAVHAASDSIKRGFGLGGLKDLLNSAAGQFDHFAASAQGAAAKMQAVHGPMQAVVDLLTGLGPELTAIAGGIAFVGAVAHDKLGRDMVAASEEASQALAGITDQVQALLRSMAELNQTGGTLAMFKDLQKSGRYRLENNTPGTPEFRKGANTVAVAQRNIQEINREIEDAIRLANGLRSVSEEIRALNTYNVTQNKKSFLKQQAEDAQALKAALQGMEFGGSNPFGIGPDQQQEALLTRYTSDMEKLQQVLGQMEGKSSNPFGITAEQIEIADHNTKKWQADLEQVNAELQDMMAVHRALGRMESQSANPFGIEQQQIEEAYNYRIKEERAFENLRLDTIRHQLNAELDAIDAAYDARTKANNAALKDFDKRLRARTDAKNAGATAGKNSAKSLDGLMMGVGFPLLFGAGPASTALSAAGSFVGSGFGGQILGGAIGQIFDQFAAAAAEMGQALRDPITNFQKLADAGLLAGKAQEFTISKLIELGRVSEATAIIQGELIKKIGVSGVNDMQAAGAAATELSKAWAELNLQMQAALSGPLAGLLEWLTSVVRIFGDANKSGSQIKDILKGLNPQQQAAFQKEMLQNNARYGTSDKAIQEEAKILAKYRGLATPQTVNGTQRAPDADVKAAEARLATAERAEALRRQGIQLERQQQDFELSVADQVYGFRRRAADLERASIDLRRSVEDEIFRKRQEIARQEIENERQRKQIAIERTDLALAGGRVSGNQPGQDLANGLLDALRQYVRGRAEAEADLQQKERSFQVEMVELRRASERYRFEVERKVSDLQRQAADYNRDVEKAKLTAERAIYDLQIAAADYRIAKAKEAIQLETQAAAQVSATNALTGQISGSAAGGKVVQHLHGDPGRAGYDPAGHGGQANAHDHFAFDSEATTRKVMEGLKKLGYVITEFGVKSGHSNGSLHYSNRAFDVPWSQFGSGPIGQNDYNRSRQLQRDVQKILGQSGGTQMSPVFQRPRAAANNIVPTATPRSVDTSGAMAALNAVRAQGVGSFNSLISASEQLDAKLIKTRELALSLAKELAAMTDKQRAEAWGNTVQAAIDSLNAPMDEILKKQGDQAAYQREYAELINKGVLPDLAKQILEIRDQVKLQLEQLDTAISVLEASKLKLQTEGKWTEELQKQLDLLKEQKGIIEGKGKKAEEGAKQAQSPDKRLGDAYTKVKEELNALTDPVNQIVAGANAIGSAFGQAFNDMASGAKSAQQALSDAFRSIGQHFIDMATQMIAKYIQMKIIGLAMSFLGGAAGGGGGGSYTMPSSTAGGSWLFGSGAPSFMAEGGFVTGPTRAIIGEGGESEYVIPASKMSSAMSRYSAGQRGSSVIAGSGGGGASGGGSGGSTFTLETVVINNVEYATVEQVRAMGEASAKRGAEGGHSKSMSTLRNSRSQRSRLGIR